MQKPVPLSLQQSQNSEQYSRSRSQKRIPKTKDQKKPPKASVKKSVVKETLQEKSLAKKTQRKTGTPKRARKRSVPRSRSNSLQRVRQIGNQSTNTGPLEITPANTSTNTTNSIVQQGSIIQQSLSTQTLPVVQIASQVRNALQQQAEDRQIQAQSMQNLVLPQQQIRLQYQQQQQSVSGIRLSPTEQSLPELFANQQPENLVNRLQNRLTLIGEHLRHLNGAIHGPSSLQARFHLQAIMNYYLDRGLQIPNLPDHDLCNVGGLTKDELKYLCVIDFHPYADMPEDYRSCAICMEDFQVNESNRLLPCLHRFHIDCIGKWLRKNLTCPICKDDVKKHIQEEAASAARQDANEQLVPGNNDQTN